MKNIFISNNCLSGYIDKALGRKHYFPIVWDFMSSHDMINLYKNINQINFNNIEFIDYLDWRKRNPNPDYYWNTSKIPESEIITIRLDNLCEIVFPHNSINNKREFIESWNRRVERYLLIKNKRFIFIYKKYIGESEETLNQFLNLEEDKILFNDTEINLDVNNLKFIKANSIYDIYNPHESLNSDYNRKFIELIRSYYVD